MLIQFLKNINLYKHGKKNTEYDLPELITPSDGGGRTPRLTEPQFGPHFSEVISPPRSVDVLWEQLKDFRVLEDKLTEESYSALVRLMTPFVLNDNRLENFEIESLLADESVPVAFRDSLEILLQQPESLSEFNRRIAVLKNWLWGSRMHPGIIKNGVNTVLLPEELAVLKTKIQWLKRQVETTEIETFGAQFHKVCAEIVALAQNQQLSPEQLLDLVAEFGWGFSNLSLMGQSFWRPRGYAGSFDMMEAIYAFNDSAGTEVMGDVRAQGWNRLLLSTTSAEDVNDRKEVIIEDILHDRSKALALGEDLRILNFASGPGRLEQDFWEQITSLGLPAKVDWQCVDGDEQAVEFARQRLKHLGNVSIEHGNVVRVLHHKNLANQFDEVLTVGLLDYFDDDFTIRALRQFYGMLKPGGAFRIGQFCTNHADQPFLELTNWHLFRRDEQTMQKLLTQAGVPSDCIEIKKISADGPQLVVTAVKPK